MDSKLGFTIFDWSDPCSLSSGGRDTFNRGLLKYAPEDAEIEFIGVTSEPEDRPVGVWSDIDLGCRAVKLFPIVAIKNIATRAPIPLSLRYTIALLMRRPRCSGNLWVVHRLEPLLPEYTDPLGEPLHMLRLDGTLHCRGEFTTPFAIEIPKLDGALTFLAITSGRCWMQNTGSKPRLLDQGNLALVPYAVPHIIGSEPTLPAVPLFLG